MAAYIALLRKDPKSDYGVEFPDFPGCVTAGGTLEEARANAEEALALHMEGMVEDGDAIPEPSSLDAVARLPESRNAVAFLVSVHEAPAKIVRVNITLPAAALARIDAAAEAAGLTRSGFIARAAKAVMQGAAGKIRKTAAASHSSTRSLLKKHRRKKPAGGRPRRSRG